MLFKKVISLFMLLTLSLVSQAQVVAFQKGDTHSMLEYYTLNTLDAAWQQNPLYVFLSADAASNDSEYVTESIEKVETHLSKMKRKQQKMSEDRFLRTLFYQTHEKFLKKYQNAVTFGEMVNTGRYDCLTGSMLYAYLLENLGVEYEIKEMSAHVYLKIYKKNGKVALFEATDPEKGYVWESFKVKDKENKYLADSKFSRYYFRYADWTATSISLQELAGLQYFNQAVVMMQKKDFSQTMTLLDKTEVYYQSSRIDEIRKMVDEYMQQSYYVSR